MWKLVSLLSACLFIIVGCSEQIELSENEKKGSNYYTLEDPPSLIVTSENTSIEAVQGTTSWYSYEADSEPPPDLVEYQKEQLNIDSHSAIELKFDVEPIEYRISLWGSEDSIQLNDGRFFIPSKQTGEFIFEVKARWKEGYAFYAFFLFVK